MKVNLNAKSGPLTLWLGGKPLVDDLILETHDLQTLEVIIEARNEDDRSTIQDLALTYDIPMNHILSFDTLKPGETGQIILTLNSEDLYDYRGDASVELDYNEFRQIGGRSR